MKKSSMPIPAFRNVKAARMARQQPASNLPQTGGDVFIGTMRTIPIPLVASTPLNTSLVTAGTFTGPPELLKWQGRNTQTQAWPAAGAQVQVRGRVTGGYALITGGPAMLFGLGLLDPMAINFLQRERLWLMAVDNDGNEYQTDPLPMRYMDHPTNAAALGAGGPIPGWYADEDPIIFDDYLGVDFTKQVELQSRTAPAFTGNAPYITLVLQVTLWNSNATPKNNDCDAPQPTPEEVVAAMKERSLAVERIKGLR